MRNVHHAIARWLLAVPLAGCCGSANADSQATVTLRQAKANEATSGKSVLALTDASTVTPENCKDVCNSAEPNHTGLIKCSPVDAGEPSADCSFSNSGACVGGRMPCGLVPRAEPDPYLARMAHNEAASVHAFVHLARELAAHGAPVPLVRDAERAAHDEVRHARLMSTFAERARHDVPAAMVAAMEVRPLADVAIENAAEGCVRETWGALLAAYQSRTETDAALRDAYAEIAHDEAFHADLAWRIDAWTRDRLPATEVQRVDDARCAAVAHLREELGGGPVELRSLFEVMAADVVEPHRSRCFRAPGVS